MDDFTDAHNAAVAAHAWADAYIHTFPYALTKSGYDAFRKSDHDPGSCPDCKPLVKPLVGPGLYPPTDRHGDGPSIPIRHIISGTITYADDCTAKFPDPHADDDPSADTDY